jgi:hypothetical protein
MSLDEEATCDGCGRPLHPNAGALCTECIELAEWLRKALSA